MRAVDIIIKKREGGELNRAEIEFFVRGLTSGEIPDYQAAAWAMAVFWRGMTARETTDLALALAYSGQTVDLSDVAPMAVDKHSTGGVGDKVTLVALPLVVAAGVQVGKMSGRGLGFTGGTVDKLEAIPGFGAALSIVDFKRQVREIGLALACQSTELAPADGKLYAVRDVTGTVDSIPLIASSVMSKKIAAGARAIVLDVKTGRGAFMPTPAAAERLARLMVSIGKRAGRRMTALVSDMNQPLGQAVGNALEMGEALEILHNRGPADTRAHCLEVAAHMLCLSGVAGALKSARARLEAALAEGRALMKFKQWVTAQGGDGQVADDPGLLPTAQLIETVGAPRSGWVAAVDARQIGLAALELGAGRGRKDEAIDHAVGLVIRRKVGERVSRGEPLFTVHANDADRLAAARERVLAAYRFSARRVAAPPLFYKVIR